MKNHWEKEADINHVILYADNYAIKIPEEFLSCIQDEPVANQFFFELTESEQQFYIRKTYEAKQETTKKDCGSGKEVVA